jgi:hypothetical protein
MDKPTILWKACESAYYLMPAGSKTMAAAVEITGGDAVKFFDNQTADFGAQAWKNMVNGDADFYRKLNDEAERMLR